MKCKLCPEASNFTYGLKGKDADKTKFLFVLNHSDSRVFQFFDYNYEFALKTSNTGVILDKILENAGLQFEDIFVTNFFKCLLPKDREPHINEYRNCLSVFENQVSEFNPRAMILFGSSPYRHLFPENSVREPLEKAVGKTFFYRDIPAHISYHPSKIWALLSPKKMEPHYEAIKEFLDSFRQQ